jgi:hypothetical protein
MNKYFIYYATLDDVQDLIGRIKLYRLSSNSPRLNTVSINTQPDGVFYHIEYVATDPLTSNSIREN